MLQKKILKIIREYKLISPLDKVLVGVSGGPDSLALLYLLNESKVKLGIKIIVAHFNHGLRGRDSDLDEKFVKDTSGKLGLDFCSKKATQKNKAGHSNEELLRRLRYDFLFSAAKRYKANKIALAHNLDDQAETVLMRLIRGAGLYGLSAILPKRKVGEFIIIRPLLEVKREEIEKYLKKINVKARIDKTNFQDIFLRNKIRYGILKELKAINPNINRTLARFAQQAAVDYDYLQVSAKKFLGVCNDPQVKINLGEFKNLHMALQRMIVRLALEKISGDLRTFTNKHWEEVRDLAANRPSGSIVHLAKEILVKKDSKNIVICRDKHK
ncbi:MAG: tRNA lysidine(34) synthetase TilS [Candidatus Omnitrophica bacterium]|nr:tRNA lysidine(34) synthetase TilS [Candidatus Omnitrophota bacterium]